MAWLVAIIGSVTGFLFGYDEGIIAGSLGLIRNYFNLNHTDVGLIASALPFGALIGSTLIGAFIASRFIKHFGRRPLLFWAGLLFLLGSLGTAMADAEWLLIMARFVLGLAIGTAAVTTPLYLAESAAMQQRGAMVAIYQLAITIGIVCAYSANYLLIEHQAWRVMFASSAIPSLILIFGIFFLPESPRWLMSVGREEAAEKALKRLRKNQNIQQEFCEIKNTLANEPAGNHWRSLFKKPLLPVLSLGMALFCLQQLSGINVIIYFAPEIFKNLGFNNAVGQMLATMGIGIINLLVTIAAVFYVDRLGRRKLLLIGFTGASISLLSLSIFSFYQAGLLTYLSVLCLTVYIFSFAISIGPVPHIAMSEIFPLRVRGIGMGMSSLSNWGFNTVTVFTFPILHHYFGIELTFALYAMICFFGLIWTYFYMPETKNISLEAIENYLMSGKDLRFLGREEDNLRVSAEQPGLA
ncbi:sugar porter family MFS transporter [Legionella jordanis]|uniref:D-xylose (Galactose, arabinose)-proton symporter n=1 Tax=Legionella jordanis TaxID=456 RepID=A0A0W0VAB2_9GAMM|nr:sugar porter family MFS transporter [Legionella jordanis]KTD17075.1 D-xylose (galactose, arabinose)-proton symporter [Legionella jordanis]RMX03208.1 sugar porter family MFS transporter [Legionella jordanis]RMX18652.1 sugar porter family MFS transporter [Legionella jordanis]VEH12728.1 D-xylose (galactose, arabinose)-proton symporter [Legionella jordanis]HAT8713123.1 sugar porter family MFS transporter [Legionella jordanis]